MATQLSNNGIPAVDSVATSTSSSEFTGTAGTSSSTSSAGKTLFRQDGNLAAGANLAVFDVPAEVLAEAMANTTNVRRIAISEPDPMAHLGLSGDMVGGMPISDVPMLPAQTQRSGVLSQLPALGQLGPVSDLVGGLGSLLPVGKLTDGLPVGGLTGGLPVSNLVGHQSAAELPEAGSPSGDLPVTGVFDELLGLADDTISSLSGADLRRSRRYPAPCNSNRLLRRRLASFASPSPQLHHALLSHPRLRLRDAAHSRRTDPRERRSPLAV